MAAEASEPTTSPHPLAATGAVASAPSPAATHDAPSLIPKVAAGFVLAQGSVTETPQARPSQRTDESLQASAGVGVLGTPFAHWDYMAYVVLGFTADANAGIGGSIAPEQITLRLTPLTGLSFQGGYMRIPFSLAQSVVITNSMFSARPLPTTVFQNGADAGFLASYQHPSKVVTVKLGIFDGLSLGLLIPNHVTRGPVLSAWVEVAPFGEMPTIEGDFGQSSFHLSVGGGVLFQNGTAYDASGYEGLHTTDTRVSAALRMAFKGVFAQGEYLYAILVDDLLGRPRITRGTYGEASYYVPFKRKVGFAPMARLGWSQQSADFFPTSVVSVESGLALYPRGDLAEPGALRLVIEYVSERQVEAEQTAYGALASALFRW